MEITVQQKSDTKMADDAFLHKIDEPSTLAGIKHLTPNTSKELQDLVVEKSGRLPEVTRFCTSLTEPTGLKYNKRRWLLVLICLKSILIPALREYIVPILTVLYNELKCNHKIDLQKYPTHLKRYPPTNDFLNYEAVNNNKAIHGNKKAKYDYKIRNAVELSKLFLQSHMGHYTGFNHTCDSSAVLELIIKIDKFPPVVRSDAENVKIYIGNLWARCDFSVWTAVKYSESFQMMEKLVKDLSLSFDKEVQLAEEIQILKIDGHYLLFGPEMIEVVRHCMVRLDASLEQLPKETDDDYLRIKNEGDIGNIIQTLYDLRRPRRHQVVGYTLQGREVIIRWPSPRQQTEIATEVEAVCSLPGVTGFIDGTHIRLSAAIGGERDYYNRKGYPSIQLQAVVDNNMKIINAYTGWPGCVHDARVLRNSSVYIKAEAGELFSQNYHIFGDNAYPLRNWLVTPFKNFGNLTRQQIKFNKRLSGVRQTVERAFGHLKGRFRRLRDVPLHDHKEVCNLIIACCVLHNLCIINEDDVEGYIEYEEEDPNNFPNVYQNGHAGVLRRLQLVNIP